MPVPISSIVAAAGSSRPKPPVAGDGDFNPIAFIAANAVAYWKMEADADAEIDATGRLNNLDSGNGVGDIETVAGKVGLARAFVAANGEYLSCASTADLQIGAGDFIVAVWMKPTSAGAGATFGVVSKPADHLLLINSEPKFQFNVGDGTGIVVAETFGAVSPGAWYFVVARLDAAGLNVHIRVNNGAVDTQGLGDVATPSAADLFVGSTDGANNFFDGLIDDTLILKTSTPMSAEDFDALCTYLWASGNGLDLSFIF